MYLHSLTFVLLNVPHTHAPHAHAPHAHAPHGHEAECTCAACTCIACTSSPYAHAPHAHAPHTQSGRATEVCTGAHVMRCRRPAWAFQSTDQQHRTFSFMSSGAELSAVNSTMQCINCAPCLTRAVRLASQPRARWATATPCERWSQDCSYTIIAEWADMIKSNFTNIIYMSCCLPVEDFQTKDSCKYEYTDINKWLLNRGHNNTLMIIIIIIIIYCWHIQK